MSWPLRSAQVKRLRRAHSVLGLTLAGLLYVICLSGALAVFHEALERWEQPQLPESPTHSAPQLAHAVDRFLAETATPPDELFVALPSASLPRMRLSADGHERYVTSSGTLDAAPADSWTHLLVHLHTVLLLPETAGLIVTGSIGALLCALILNGLLSHPNLVKDLFRWRRDRSDALHHTDLHNRLGVWGSPFFLMFGLTGAFFGLIGVLVAAGAERWFDGDRDALIASVYGADIQVVGAPPQIDFQQTLDEMARLAPDATPIYLMIHRPGTERQFVEVGATLPGRLIYSEIYRFDASGTPLGHQGLSDGPLARQIAYSVYRLHFGHFGGWASKLLYGVLGLALAWVCVSGVNIWLARRDHRSVVNGLWDGLVWGTPIALAASAMTALLEGPAQAVLLATLALLPAAAGALPGRLGPVPLRGLLALCLVALAGVHAWRFGIDQPPVVVAINGALCASALCLTGPLLAARHRRPRATTALGAPEGPAA
ncbi:PepSY-associated TM helix domain-containing protein [Immundisolibacter sp.]|uniref:PepSY-associated TM helix domain-containing protein n=1 Tax=Immundisolibacter sp. TaxID=1934948 RepID=UPI003565CDC5